MRVHRILAIALAHFAVIALSCCAETKEDPQKKLETAIPEAIRLLEAKEYARFIKSYAAPEELKRITARSSLEELAKNFAAGKAERVLEVLKEIKDQTPTLDADGKQATFKLKERPSGKKTIVFVKVDGCWYIRN